MTVATIYGPMSVPPGEDLIACTLASHGEWSYAEAQLLAPLSRPTDAVWDIGAHIGTFSLGLAGLAPPARVVAIEASGAAFSLLDENFARNLAVPFDIRNLAVTRTTGGQLRALVAQPGNAGSTRFTPAGPEAAGDAVPGRSLRDLRAELGDYDMLKLDIEGAELDALRGDLDYLRARKPVIWAECNESPASLPLFGALKWLGYQPLYVAYPAFRQRNFNACPEPPFPCAYEAGLLAAPAERLATFKPQVAGEDLIVRPLATSFDLCRALWDTPRWAKGEWARLSRPELIARLGRVSAGKDLRAFCGDLGQRPG